MTGDNCDDYDDDDDDDIGDDNDDSLFMHSEYQDNILKIISKILFDFISVIKLKISI